MRIIVFFIGILFLILSVRVVLFFQSEKTYKPGDVFKEQITLLTEPKIQFSYQIIRYQGVRIELPLEPELHYGDTIITQGLVETDSFTAKNGEEVVLLVIKSPVINHLGTKNPFIISTAFIRERVWSVFSKTIPRSEAGLLFGIVFGGTQGFSSDLTNAFRNTGVFHVVAASGMNVTLVSGFLFAITSKLLKRQLAIIISISGIFYYALLAGFEPSILRAAIMAGIAFSAGIVGRQNYAFLTLLLTAWIMIMISPRTAFDIGFLLSFSSTVGIIGFKSFFDSFKIAKKTRGISDDLTTTISAQIGSFPFMSLFFSSYSGISIVVNAFVLWTIPILMVLGALASILAILIPNASFIPLYISLPLLWYFEKVVIFFSNIPLLQFENISVFVWIGYYAILASFMIMIKKKR